MADNGWEKTESKQNTGSWVSTLLQIATLGIAARPDQWEVIYTNRLNGRTVRGIGTTEQEADARARQMCA